MKKKLLLSLFAVCAVFTVLVACGPSRAMLNMYDNDAAIGRSSPTRCGTPGFGDNYFWRLTTFSERPGGATAEFSDFSGVKTLGTVSIGGDTAFELNINMSGGSGKLKFVLVTNGYVFRLWEGILESREDIYNKRFDGIISVGQLRAEYPDHDFDGDYLVRMVGHKASAEFTIEW